MCQAKARYERLQLALLVQRYFVLNKNICKKIAHTCDFCSLVMPPLQFFCQNAVQRKRIRNKIFRHSFSIFDKICAMILLPYG